MLSLSLYLCVCLSLSLSLSWESRTDCIKAQSEMYSRNMENLRNDGTLVQMETGGKWCSLSLSISVCVSLSLSLSHENHRLTALKLSQRCTRETWRTWETTGRWFRWRLEESDARISPHYTEDTPNKQLVQHPESDWEWLMHQWIGIQQLLINQWMCGGGVHFKCYRVITAFAAFLLIKKIEILWHSKLHTNHTDAKYMIVFFFNIDERL